MESDCELCNAGGRVPALCCQRLFAGSVQLGGQQVLECDQWLAQLLFADVCWDVKLPMADLSIMQYDQSCGHTLHRPDELA